MGRREKQRTKHCRDEFEEAERDKSREKSSKSLVNESSSDDDEANEDLTLKLVEKALLMRAAKLVSDNDGSVELNRCSGLLDLPPSSSSQEVEFVEGPARIADSEVVVASENGGLLKKKRIVKRVKKKKTSKMEIEDLTVSVSHPLPCLFRWKIMR